MQKKEGTTPDKSPNQNISAFKTRIQNRNTVNNMNKAKTAKHATAKHWPVSQHNLGTQSKISLCFLKKNGNQSKCCIVKQLPVPMIQLVQEET